MVLSCLRVWLRGLALAALLGAGVAQAALVLAINEGVTYRVPNDEIRARYAAIAADLSRLLAQPVVIEPVADYPSLRQGLSERTFDLAMVHPAHISILAMKQSGYKLLALTKGYQDYKANFLVRADSPLKTLADLRGRRVGVPDEDSITAWMARAALRDQIGKSSNASLVYTRYQDAVPYFVDNRLTESGATAAPAVVRAWLDKGGRVLGASRPIPIKHVIASPKLSAEQIDKVREYLLALDGTEDGRKKLAPTKFSGFVRGDEAELLALGAWLGL